MNPSRKGKAACYYCEYWLCQDHGAGCLISNKWMRSDEGCNKFSPIRGGPFIEKVYIVMGHDKYDYNGEIHIEGIFYTEEAAKAHQKELRASIRSTVQAYKIS